MRGTWWSYKGGRIREETAERPDGGTSVPPLSRFVETLKNRHRVYNETLKEIHEMEKTGDTFVIRPSEKLTISRMEKDLKEIQRVYDIGRKDAENHIDALCRWMEASAGED